MNCGSSSLKFAILDPISGDEKLSGLAENFNLENARIKWKLNGEKGEAQLGAGAAHSEALTYLASNILSAELKDSIGAIGHRIVHGGEKFTSSAIVTDEVIQGIKDATQFAPLHNPAHLIGIEEAFKIFPALKEKKCCGIRYPLSIKTMPEKAYLYALPTLFIKNMAYVVTVSHGTSHYFVSQRLQKQLVLRQKKQISLLAT
ncbi:hypothetical protein [Bibersteinia trehalosi]|uniref:hypothetical protein n=1 Tax=Bibersteinia trehalosi TaxID=47735 RepID=UPI000B0247B7|nr:hypothetical protein [Bibersteinia trehalosi]